MAEWLRLTQGGEYENGEWNELLRATTPQVWFITINSQSYTSHLISHFSYHLQKHTKPSHLTALNLSQVPLAIFKRLQETMAVLMYAPRGEEQPSISRWIHTGLFTLFNRDASLFEVILIMMYRFILLENNLRRIIQHTQAFSKETPKKYYQSDGQFSALAWVQYLLSAYHRSMKH